jgi:protein KTI12
MAEQAASGGIGGAVTLSLPNGVKAAVTLPPRNVTLSELQRIKRQFVTVNKKAITLGTIEKGAVDWSEERIAEKFSAYVEDNVKS